MAYSRYQKKAGVIEIQSKGKQGRKVALDKCKEVSSDEIKDHVTK